MIIMDIDIQKVKTYAHNLQKAVIGIFIVILLYTIGYMKNKEMAINGSVKAVMALHDYLHIPVEVSLEILEKILLNDVFVWIVSFAFCIFLIFSINYKLDANHGKHDTLQNTIKDKFKRKKEDIIQNGLHFGCLKLDFGPRCNIVLFAFSLIWSCRTPILIAKCGTEYCAPWAFQCINESANLPKTDYNLIKEEWAALKAFFMKRTCGLSVNPPWKSYIPATYECQGIVPKCKLDTRVNILSKKQRDLPKRLHKRMRS